MGVVHVVFVCLGVVVIGILLPYKLCNVAGPSPSVTSAPDRVFHLNQKVRLGILSPTVSSRAFKLPVG